MKGCARIFLWVVVSIFAAQGALAQTTRHVSSRVPIQGNSSELSAERAVTENAGAPSLSVATATHSWTLQATLPGAVIHDISFPSTMTGFAAAELGQVWKTSDGGKTWTEVLNLGFPYYWYGVHAFSATNVVVSGFNDSNFEGILRWSKDGGATWSSDVVLTNSGWSFRIRFANAKVGLVMDGLNLDAANGAHFTVDGGATAADWTAVVPDPNGGWFGNQFSLLPNQHTRASGITYCSSTNSGANWTCGPPVDSVFDGPVFFATDSAGWVGGGEISPNVEGWVHRTTDGGSTWSARTLDGPWPIREIMFLNSQSGWAAGGNVYSGVGGIYYSADGGQTWTVDATTNAEMDACDSHHSPTNYQIWCAGYDSSFNGVVYTLKGKHP